jgi:hypothetical protein
MRGEESREIPSVFGHTCSIGKIRQNIWQKPDWFVPRFFR